MNRYFKIGLILIISTILLSGCSSSKTKQNVNTLSLLDRVTSLEQQFNAINSKMINVESGLNDTKNNYSFGLTNVGIRIKLPAGTQKVNFEVTLIPKDSYYLSASTYENALLEIYKKDLLNKTYYARIMYDNKVNKWMLYSMIFYTGSVTLTASPKDYDVAYTSQITCVPYINVIGGS